MTDDRSVPSRSHEFYCLRVAQRLKGTHEVTPTVSTCQWWGQRLLAERSRYEEVEEISARDALAGAEHAACPPCVCYQFITATHTGYFRIPACATARCSEEARGNGGEEATAWRDRLNRRRARRRISENMRRPRRQRRICPASLSLSLFTRAYLEGSRNVSSVFLLGIRLSRYFVAIFECDFAHLTTTGSRAHAHTHSRARARTHTERREERERTHRRGRSSYPGRCVLGIARSDRGRRSAAPTTKRSFLRRHRSSLSRSATVVHVRPCSAGKCVYAVKEKERESWRVRMRGRNSEEEEEESKGAREESRGRLVGGWRWSARKRGSRSLLKRGTRRVSCMYSREADSGFQGQPIKSFPYRDVSHETQLNTQILRGTVFVKEPQSDAVRWIKRERRFPLARYARGIEERVAKTIVRRSAESVRRVVTRCHGWLDCMTGRLYVCRRASIRGGRR